LEQITLGTAGHIDHGKSTLVQALTGTDPDRLKEEKERGITLDLGFAHFEPVPGKRVSLVDVPGHEGLVHNMLAGAQGLSGVLLLVAADQGVMPQTLEHFNLLKLLGLKKGLVVVSKADLADPELLQLLGLELEERFRGSFLEAAPILFVSAKTGQGVEALKQALVERFFPGPEPQGSFRLPIDRSFSLKGFGTVVSGTVISGATDLDRPLWLYPQKTPVKFRGFHSLGQPTSTLVQGMRGAVNLQGFEPKDLERGQQLAEPDSLVVTQKLAVRLEPIAAEAHKISARKPVSVFVHAAQAQGRLVPLETFEPKAGPLLCLLQLDRPLALRFGDVLVLRGGSPERSLAGARALSLSGPLNRRTRKVLVEQLAQLEQGDLAQRVRVLASLAGLGGISRLELGPRTGAPAKEIEKVVAGLLARQELVEPDKVEKRLFCPEQVRRLIGFFQKSLLAFHQAHPEEAGAPADHFFGSAPKGLSQGQVAGLLAWAGRQNLLAKTDKFYHLEDFKGGLSPAQKALEERCLDRIGQLAPNLPGLFHLAEDLGLDSPKLLSCLKLAEKRGKLVQVGEEFFFRPQDLETLWEQTKRELQKQQTLTVIGFKELFGLPRKLAIALLEHFDHRKKTLRHGDYRSLYHED